MQLLFRTHTFENQPANLGTRGRSFAPNVNSLSSQPATRLGVAFQQAPHNPPRIATSGAGILSTAYVNAYAEGGMERVPIDIFTGAVSFWNAQFSAQFSATMFGRQQEVCL